jgi:hypothetical protein
MQNEQNMDMCIFKNIKQSMILLTLFNQCLVYKLPAVGLAMNYRNIKLRVVQSWLGPRAS